jgi:hypothetical protein
MLVHFVVDTEAIAEAENLKLHEAKAVFLRLLQYWMRFGVLLHEGETFSDSRFCKSLNRLPESIADRVKQGIKSKRLRICSAPPNWSGPATVEDADTLTALRGHAELVTLSEISAELLGISAEEISEMLFNESLEIVRLAQIDQAQRFRKADELSRTQIAIGRQVLDAWNERFAALTRHSRQIIIVDRYAGDSHLKGFNGLSRCLAEIDRCGVKATVSVYTGDADQQPPARTNILESMTRLAESRKTRGGIRTVKLFVAPDRLFKGGNGSVFPEGAHDRYIRFDNSVVSLGQGVSVFSGGTVEKHCTFHLSDHTEVERKIESALQRQSVSCVI